MKRQTDSTDEWTRVAHLEAAFAERHRVKKFRVTPWNLSRALRSGGASAIAAKKILARIAPWGAFDHLDVWGRGRTPMMLVSHPYGLDAEAHELLDQVKALGL